MESRDRQEMGDSSETKVPGNGFQIPVSLAEQEGACQRGDIGREGACQSAVLVVSEAIDPGTQRIRSADFLDGRRVGNEQGSVRPAVFAGSGSVKFSRIAGASTSSKHSQGLESVSGEKVVVMATDHHVNTASTRPGAGIPPTGVYPDVGGGGRVGEESGGSDRFDGSLELEEGIDRKVRDGVGIGGVGEDRQDEAENAHQQIREQGGQVSGKRGAKEKNRPAGERVNGQHEARNQRAYQD